MARKFDDNQKNAINTIKNSVVSAGAGSGKTTVLSERFLNLIQNHGAGVDQILTLTFTKKATVEMSDRIYKVLKQKSPEQAAKFNKANIKTIDSYFAGIAKLSSRHFGISPDFVQDKDKIHDFAYSLALQTILENRSHSAIKYLISTKNYDDIASELFMPVLNNSTVISPLDFDSMLEKQLQELISVWNKFSKEIEKEFENASSNIVNFENTHPKDPPKTFINIKNIFQLVGDFFTVELTKEKILSKNLEEPENFIMLLFSLSKLPLPGNTKGLDEYKQSVLKFRETHELLVSVFNYAYYFDIVQDYFSLAKDFQQKITDFKRTAGILTFADISDLALKTLIEFPEIRQIEKEKYKYIMIDEFQDNNEMQKSILFLLAENLSRTEKSVPKAEELCPEKLFFVGDEKQSIYKFRGADVSVFRKLSGEFPDGNMNMSTNYRSHPALISMFNTFFGGFPYPSYPQESKELSHSIFFSENSPETQGCPDYEAVYKEVTIPSSTKEKISLTNLKEIYKPHTHFALYDKDTETDSLHYSEHDCEAEWIAAKIEELLQTQKKTVRKIDSLGNETEEKVLISPNDIAILLRDTKEQFHYERSLLRHGIPYTSSAATGIFSDGVVNDIFSFLRICVYESDSLSYAQVLSSPFVNLSAKETNSVLLESQEPFAAEGKNLSAESRKRFQKSKEFYLQMKEFSKANPISKTVSKLWYESGYYFETLWNQNVTMYNIHYDMILTMALQAEQEQKTLAGFLDDARQYSSDTVKIDDLDIPVEESNGVQIMTVHKSKGLEFEVVFVANTCKGTANMLSQVYFDSKFGLSINTPIFPRFEAKTKQNYFYKIAKELNERMQSAELRRVVYVALTRAKTELFITNPKYKVPKQEDLPKMNKFLPGRESNPSSFFDVLEPIYNLFTAREDYADNDLMPFDVEIIEPIPRNAPSKNQKRLNNYASKKNLLLYIQKEKLYENVKVYQTEYPEPLYTNPSHLSKDDDEIFSNFKIVENAPYQKINQIVLESVPQTENEQNEDEAEPAFSFANFGTIAHAYLESVISGKKPEEHYSVKEFIGLENKTEKIQEIKKICEEMKNAFENSNLGKRAKNSTKHFAELNFRSKLSSKIVKGVVDLIFEDSDGTFTVVDYKTNQTVVPEIYYAQLKCYKDAVCQIFGKSKNEVKCVLYYLRYAKAVNITEECDKINLKEF